MRKHVEIVLIVIGYLALREAMAHVWWRLPNPTDSALPFYLVWLVPCAIAMRVWARPRGSPSVRAGNRHLRGSSSSARSRTPSCCTAARDRPGRVTTRATFRASIPTEQ